MKMDVSVMAIARPLTETQNSNILLLKKIIGLKNLLK